MQVDTAPRSGRDVDHRRRREGVRAAAHDGICALGRGMVGRRACRGALWRVARAHLLRRIDVRPAADASKVALVTLAERLARWGFRIIDAQVPTPHTVAMGAEDWPRKNFSRCYARRWRTRRGAGAGRSRSHPSRRRLGNLRQPVSCDSHGGRSAALRSGQQEGERRSGPPRAKYDGTPEDSRRLLSRWNAE